MRGLQQALRRNPERIYNIVVKPIERSTRITQADEEQGVSQAPRFGFKEREMFQANPTRGIPYSSILPIDPQFAEPLFSLVGLGITLTINSNRATVRRKIVMIACDWWINW